MIAPPFLGLLACYDTKRALNTHRACVIVFFLLTIVYMFTTLSIYRYLATMEVRSSHRSARGKTTSPSAGHKSPEEEIHNVQYSLKLKSIIALIFVLLTTFYLPIGTYLCSDPFSTEYNKEDVYIHAARALCQHLAVVCIILYYGTFCLDFGNLQLSAILS